MGGFTTTSDRRNLISRQKLHQRFFFWIDLRTVEFLMIQSMNCQVQQFRHKVHYDHPGDRPSPGRNKQSRRCWNAKLTAQMGWDREGLTLKYADPLGTTKETCSGFKARLRAKFTRERLILCNKSDVAFWGQAI